jgi:hypothetical protein
VNGRRDSTQRREATQVNSFLLERHSMLHRVQMPE